MGERTGHRALLEWVLALALMAFAVVSAASIGMLVLPFAIGAIVLVTRRNHVWPESLFGGLLGAAAVCLFIAYVQRDSSPCPSSGTEIIAPGERGSCGGFDPLPWLVVGLTLAAAGLGGYASFRSRRRAIA